MKVFIIRAESTQAEELGVGNAGFGVAMMIGVGIQLRVSISGLVEHQCSELAMFYSNEYVQEFNWKQDISCKCEFDRRMEVLD